MTPREQGFLLLTSHLGQPGRRPLTLPQMEELAERVRASRLYMSAGDLKTEHLMALGYSMQKAEYIVQLLSEEALANAYVNRAASRQCVPVTRSSLDYPMRLRIQLGARCPGTLWCKGDRDLLTRSAVSLVGSRDLYTANGEFAREVGYQAARQGYVLVSGNARGADTAAQESCLDAGGCVISVVPDKLSDHPLRKNMLYISEEDFDAPFTGHRALSRNHIIHALGEITFVAQSSLRRGGTWDGSIVNLQNRWSKLCVFRDGSAAAAALEQQGAQQIPMEALTDFSILQP